MGIGERMRGRSRGRTIAFAVVCVLAVAGTVAVAASLQGTSGPDRLVGTDAGDRIAGKGGPDTLLGRGGRDRLRGGSGGDELRGGGERDKLKGGKGSDQLEGGEGTDKLFGGKGRDGFGVRDGVLLGSPGDDVIRAQDGTADEIDCADGFDKAFVDKVEDGVFNCEIVLGPDGEVGGQPGGTE
jgi:Ca2+-binding RTX toxin-like protein